jgi:hypothetical protein
VSGLRWRDGEDGLIGLVVLVGGVIGVPHGALFSSSLWDVVCRVGSPGSLDTRCGLEGLLFSLVGVPVGAVAGVVIGVFVGHGRRSEDAFERSCRSVTRFTVLRMRGR